MASMNITRTRIGTIGPILNGTHGFDDYWQIDVESPGRAPHPREIEAWFAREAYIPKLEGGGFYCTDVRVTPYPGEDNKWIGVARIRFQDYE
jgi:hypothetical protein